MTANETCGRFCRTGADPRRIRHATDLDITSCWGREGGVLSKNERNFVCVWGGYGQALRSVTKRYMGVGGSLKYQQKSVTYFMDGPAP